MCGGRAKWLLSYFNGWHCKCGPVSFCHGGGTYWGAYTCCNTSYATHLGLLCSLLMYFFFYLVIGATQH